jgi:hypothetical protein
VGTGRKGEGERRGWVGMIEYNHILYAYIKTE